VNPDAIAHLEQTCFACPSQWEGRLEDGTEFYVRFRGNRLRIGFGATFKEAVDHGIGMDGLEPHLTFCPPGGHPLDGVMGWGEVVPHFAVALANYRAQQA